MDTLVLEAFLIMPLLMFKGKFYSAAKKFSRQQENAFKC